MISDRLLFSFRGKKNPEDGMIETSLNIEMTDKTFETADFSSSEKQVRFSMKTIRTPPASPKPSSNSRFQRTNGQTVPAHNYPLVPKSTNTNVPSPATGKNLEALQAVENIKLNFLEKLEILPESKA